MLSEERSRQSQLKASLHRHVAWYTSSASETAFGGLYAQAYRKRGEGESKPKRYCRRPWSVLYCLLACSTAGLLQRAGDGWFEDGQAIMQPFSQLRCKLVGWQLEK